MRRLPVVVACAALVAACSAAPGPTPPPSAPPATTSAPGSATSAPGPSSATPAASAPALPPPTTPLRAHERFLTVGVADDLPGRVYAPAAPAGGTDDYRCFLADPHLVAPAFVTGVQFLPGNPAVVHHSILFRVDPDQVAAAQAKDDADPRPGWECFGGPGLPSRSANPLDALDSAPWLAGWAPGGRESLFGRGTGVPVPAGSRIVIQMHYNLRDVGTAPVTDSTHVRLRVSDDAGLTPLRTMLLPAPVELPCLPGETGPLCDRQAALADVVARFGPGSARTVAGLQLLCGGSFVAPRAGSVQSCTRYLREPVTVRAAAGHMHLLGRSITVVANAGTPRERTILDIPVWDFDNQSARPLRTPLRLRAGDTITVTCRHDARLRTQLPALADLPPRYVVWGEGTTDEMCLGILITS
ncbi:MAG: monooxygenase [Frankiales bacterium]|nr:monooxygenase [Frankiales bacterium]